MSTIRCIYHPNADGSRRDPGFPATDQHPQAARYAFDHPTRGLLNIDALNGVPSQAEVDAVLALDAAGLASAGRSAADAAEAVTVRADNQVQAFLNFTPAELDTWVDNNIAGAATLGALRTVCATAFKVLGRIALAAGRGKNLR